MVEVYSVAGASSVIIVRSVTGAVVGARVAQSTADLKPPCIFPRLLFESFQSY